MSNLKNVIYLSNEDYELLLTTGSVTINGTTLTYDENDIYITPDVLASQTENGLMSAEDKIKLDSIQPEIYITKAENVTYSELKTLRDNSNLVPGKQYRITDYQCTTATTNTSSAGHNFDIIVIADSESVLNENARAIQHEGDTYFANNDLSTWELKYSLDNDSSRFGWAQEGVPAVLPTWVEDNRYKYNRNADYDILTTEDIGTVAGRLSIDSSAIEETLSQFYNAGFKYAWLYGTTNYDYLAYTSTLEVTVNTPFKVIVVEAYTTNHSYHDDSCVNSNYQAPVAAGKGVIYWLKDEFNNEAPYDFKNILFTGSSADGSVSFTNVYTFTYTESSTLKDASLLGLNKYCYNNVIKEYYYSFRLQLTWNIFYSTSTSFSCHDNAFGTSCRYNTFRNICSNNTFRGSCYNNTFGSECSGNTFGNEFHDSTFGNGCKNNTFGNWCNYNTFGNSCDYNTFGNSCTYNTFGIRCCSNTFRNDCNNNTFGNGYENNIFGDDCDYITFGTASGTINWCQYNIIDSSCKYLYINSTDTTATGSNYLQNVHIHLGVKGSSSENRRTITVPDRALEYEYNVVKAGTTTVEI